MTGLAALLIPGNMCDARMWRGGGDIIRTTLAGMLGAKIVDAVVSEDSSVAAMASRNLELCEGPLLLAGFSMGAIVAVEMALIAPERVSALILSGYNATSDLPERARLRPSQQMAVRRGGLERILIHELKPNYLAEANRYDAELLGLLLEMGMAIGAAAFAFQSEALRCRADRVASLSSLSCPVLYIAGAEDRLCPPAWHRRWADLTPCSTFVELEGAGHMAPLERPKHFARAIQDWISDNNERLAA